MTSLRAGNPLIQSVAVIALTIVGLLIAGPVGAVLLALVVAVLVYALAASWQRMPLPERLLRVAVILLLIAVAVVRISAA